ncbi:MAG: OmpP1/FadL family transporter [bacterium]
MWLLKSSKVDSLFLCGLITIATPSLCLVQTNTENFAQFEFNFNNPGARAMGIGGAFISIADDATAAEANPAGLGYLTHPEISFEFKGLKFRTNVTNFAHTGTQSDYTIIERNFENSVVSPSFASFMFPIGNTTVSFFRYELVNFESSFFTKGSFVPPLTDGSFFFPVDSEINFDVTNYGGSVGIFLHRKVSIGFSGGISLNDINSRLTRYAIEVFEEGNINNEAIIDDTDTNFFFNTGFILKPLKNLSIGGIYKRRPKFSLEHSFTFTNFPSDSTAIKDVNFNIPSAFGFGISYRPIDVLTFAFDVVRINYSDLTKDMVSTIIEEHLEPADFDVDDGTEYHFGAEYVAFFKSLGFVFRAGGFTEPDNRIRWVGDIFNSNDDDRVFARQTQAALFAEGDEDFHYTFGLGVIFPYNFQVDLAGNLSNGSDELAASIVYRF